MIYPNLLLFLSLGACEAAVQFSHSTLYDVYDFAEQEVHLPNCDHGCVIFASAVASAKSAASEVDSYAQNLLIIDNNHDRNQSIAELSLAFDEKTGQKTALTIQGPASISVINQNGLDAVVSPVVLYVVEQNTAIDSSYEVYDSTRLNGLSISPYSAITVMSAAPFTLNAEKVGTSNGVTARLAGFDNAYNNHNQDNCPVVFSISTSPKFAGFSLPMTVPIISLVFDQRNSVTLTARVEFDDHQSLATDGFITSAGYNGCRNPMKPELQTFRSPLYLSSEKYLLTSEGPYKYTINLVPSLDENHQVIINDITNNNVFKFNSTASYWVYGTSQSVEVSFENLEGDQGFLLTHMAVPALMVTEAASTSPTSSTHTVSTSTLSATTSGSVAVTLLSAVATVVVAGLF